jgi:NADH:ubiquinone oxidoreductase subunit 2 (subunit N)
VLVLIASLALSLVSFAFYFRLVRAMWFAPAEGSAEDRGESVAVDAGVVVACAVAALLVVVLGVLMRVPGLP